MKRMFRASISRLDLAACLFMADGELSLLIHIQRSNAAI